MVYYLDKMKKRKIKPEDIIFWIIILGLIAIVLWMLSGSPTETGAIIGIGTFISASLTLIWKKFFYLNNKIETNLLKLDNKTALSFEKIRNSINSQFNRLEEKFEKIENKLNQINDKL